MSTDVLTHAVDFVPDFKNDVALVDEIFSLTRPSYKSNVQLVSAEVRHNRDIYVIRDRESALLLAFFMVNPEMVDGSDTYYLGLSACRDSHKGCGLVGALYMQFMRDCRRVEHESGKRILLWWTTVSPIVYSWFNKHIVAVQPDMRGAYDAAGKRVVEKIIAEKYSSDLIDRDHPFILRGLVTETSFSEQEVRRLNSASRQLNCGVFDVFGVSELNGDRFLMIGYAPDA